MLKRRGPQRELGPALSGGLEGRPTGQVPLARDQSAAASAFPASSSAVKPGTAEGGQQGERRGSPLPAGHCPPALSPRWRPERTCDRGSGQPGTPAGTAGPSASPKMPRGSYGQNVFENTLSTCDRSNPKHLPGITGPSASPKIPQES